jgi:hypothetical protein
MEHNSAIYELKSKVETLFAKTDKIDTRIESMQFDYDSLTKQTEVLVKRTNALEQECMRIRSIIEGQKIVREADDIRISSLASAVDNAREESLFHIKSLVLTDTALKTDIKELDKKIDGKCETLQYLIDRCERNFSKYYKEIQDYYKNNSIDVEQIIETKQKLKKLSDKFYYEHDLNNNTHCQHTDRHNELAEKYANLKELVMTVIDKCQTKPTLILLDNLEDEDACDDMLAMLAGEKHDEMIKKYDDLMKMIKIQRLADTADRGDMTISFNLKDGAKLTCVADEIKKANKKDNNERKENTYLADYKKSYLEGQTITSDHDDYMNPNGPAKMEGQCQLEWCAAPALTACYHKRYNDMAKIPADENSFFISYSIREAWNDRKWEPYVIYKTNDPHARTLKKLKKKFPKWIIDIYAEKHWKTDVYGQEDLVVAMITRDDLTRAWFFRFEDGCIRTFDKKTLKFALDNEMPLKMMRQAEFGRGTGVCGMHPDNGWSRTKGIPNFYETDKNCRFYCGPKDEGDDYPYILIPEYDPATKSYSPPLVKSKYDYTNNHITHLTVPDNYRIPPDNYRIPQVTHINYKITCDLPDIDIKGKYVFPSPHAM